MNVFNKQKNRTRTAVIFLFLTFFICIVSASAFFTDSSTEQLKVTVDSADFDYTLSGVINNNTEITVNFSKEAILLAVNEENTDSSDLFRYAKITAKWSKGTDISRVTFEDIYGNVLSGVTYDKESEEITIPLANGTKIKRDSSATHYIKVILDQSNGPNDTLNQDTLNFQIVSEVSTVKDSWAETVGPVELKLHTDFRQLKYTVKYNANGGIGTMADQEFTYGIAQNLNANSFTNTGYTFEGWATSENGSVTYTDKASVINLTSSNGDTVNLYAVWKKIVTPIMQSWTADATTDFHKTRSLTAEVIFMQEYNLPENFDTEAGHGPWDVSEAKDGSVMAYMVTNYVNYKLYICANVGTPTKVIANPDSSNIFYNFQNLELIDAENLDTSNVTDISYMFYECSDLINIEGLSNWDTGAVTDMSYMFYDCNELSNLTSLNNWNVSNVKNMSAMFLGCSSLTKLDGLNNWNTCAVTDMKKMFQKCSSVTDLDALASWDTRVVTNMSTMFYSCSGLTTLDGLAGWDTGSVTDMSDMFFDCNSLTVITELSNWDTSAVTDMGGMFAKCSNLISINLAGWDTSAVKYMDTMFYICTNLKTIYVEDLWNTNNVTKSTSMFDSCNSLVGGNGTPYNHSYKDKKYALIDASGRPGYLTGPLYTVVFDANGGVGSMETQKFAVNLSSALYANKFKREGYVFTGWATSASGDVVYTNLEKINNLAEPNETITLYAKWRTPTEPIMQSWSSSATSDFHKKKSSNMVIEFLQEYNLPDGFDITAGYGPWDVSAAKDESVMAYMVWDSTLYSYKLYICANAGQPTKVIANSNSSYMFYKFNATSINAENLDTSNVTNMLMLFYDCSKLTEVNLKGWDTSNVTNMVSMFRSCSRLQTIHVGVEWNTDNVTSSGNMFYGCTSLKGGNGTAFDSTIIDKTYARIDVPGTPGYLTTQMFTVVFDANGGSGTMENQNVVIGYASNLTSNTFIAPEGYVFAGWSTSTNGPIQYTDGESINIETAKDKDVITLYAKWAIAPIMMAGHSTSSTEFFYQYRSSINTVVFMQEYNLPATISYGPWDVSEANNGSVMAYMVSSSLYICANTGVPAKIIANENCSNLFYYFKNLKTITSAENLDTSSVTNMSNMFRNCSLSNKIEGFANWDTGSVTNMNNMFNGCSGLTNIDSLSNWDTSSVTDMSYMFYSCRSLTNVDGISEWDTGAVTDVSYMFSECNNLLEVDLSGWDTGNVTNMSRMFYYCLKLTNIDGLANWNTGSVTTMQHMFNGCNKLSDIDSLSGWDTGAVTNMSSMFTSCYALSEVDLSAWDTGAVTNMASMFESCNGLTKVDISVWNTNAVTNMHMIFYNCSSLIELDLSGWNTGAVTNMSSMFYYCSNLKTVYVGSDWNTQKVTSSSSMFKYCSSIVGGNGTIFDSNRVDKSYARIDKSGQPGYFTAKTGTASLQLNLNGGEVLDA